MITCPACGKENEDSALECRRCRAPLREEMPEEQAPAEASNPLGMVCGRCEAFNEPGVQVCTNCGEQLYAAAPDAGFAPDVTPADPVPSHSFTAEFRALAISDEEAAEAGISSPGGNGHEAGPPGVAVGAVAGLASARRAPEPPQQAAAPKASEPVSAPAEKACASCGAGNPPAAKFCSDCGTPFARKAPPPEPVRAAPPPPAPKIEPVRSAPPPSVEIAPSVQVDPELSEATAESSPVSVEPQFEEPLPEELPASSAEPVRGEEPLPEQATPEELPLEEAFAADALPEELPAWEAVAEEPVAEEAPPPFQASLIVERGSAPGASFPLVHLENSVGASGAHIELAEDPFVAPHAATLLFEGDHLALRDEGSANGVFIKVRESAPLEPGDLFVAGERLFRYDGAVELPRDGEGETPFLGAPRPPAGAVRVTEVLAGGKTGRTCHRSGPVIAIGRTGCDLNFPSDAILAARHAEIRLGDDGSATLVDLGAGPSGVLIRVRAQAQQHLSSGDVLLLGDQQLRLEVG